MIFCIVYLDNVRTGAIDINLITGNKDYKEIFYQIFNWKRIFCLLDLPIKSYLKVQSCKLKKDW